MTTQSEHMQATRLVQTKMQIKAQFWPIVLTALFFLTLIAAAVWVNPSRGEVLSNNRPALAAISARYQAQADAINAVDSSQALAILSNRYQGMLDVHAAGLEAQTLSSLRIISTRYQAQADAYNSTNDLRALAILSERYQAQLDRFASP